MISAITGWFSQYALLLLAAVAVAGWGYGGVQTLRVSKAKSETVALQGRWDAQSLQRETVARQATEAARVTEAQRAADQRKALDEQFLKTASARIDADIAHAAFARLQQRAAIASRNCGGPASGASAAAASAPAATGTAVPADVLQGVGEASGQLAAIADDARIRGQLCEAAYDALRK